MPTSKIRAMRYSARDVDPMSWFTGPYVPLVFAAFIAVYGGTMTIASWSQPELPGTQLAGVALCVLACLLVQVLTSLRNRFDWQLGAAVVAVAGAGFIVAALGYRRQDFPMEQWWAPFCFAIALSSLAPYLSTWRLLFWGTLPLVTIVPAVFLIIDARVPDWGSVSVFLILDPARRGGRGDDGVLVQRRAPDAPHRGEPVERRGVAGSRARPGGRGGGARHARALHGARGAVPSHGGRTRQGLGRGACARGRERTLPARRPGVAQRSRLARPPGRRHPGRGGRSRTAGSDDALGATHRHPGSRACGARRPVDGCHHDLHGAARARRRLDGGRDHARHRTAGGQAGAAHRALLLQPAR